jgi:hypothetical protein
MAINAKTNPKSDIAADVLTAAAPFGVGPKLALGQRALGAAIGTGLEGVGQYQKGELDPTRLAAAAGTGLLFNQPRAFTQKFESAVGAVAGRVTNRPELWQQPQPHGSPGPESSVGIAEQATPATTAESQTGDPQNKVTRSERDYPAAGIEPAAPGGGVHVGDVDPTLKAALDAKTADTAPPAAEAPPIAEPQRPPMMAPAEDARVMPEMAAPTTPREAIEQRAPRTEAEETAPPPAGTAVGKVGDFTILRETGPQGKSNWHAIDPETGQPIHDEPFTSRQQAANAAHDEIQRRRTIPEEELGPEGTPTSVGAAAAPPPGAPLVTQPSLRARLTESVRTGIDNLLDVGRSIGRDLQMKIAPMATGSGEAMTLVKDHANLNRRIDTEWLAHDHYLERTFSPEDRKNMWRAADEENSMRQRGEVNEHMGIARLTPEQRAAVESFQPKARELWEQARKAGMVGEEAEGLPYYTPRILMNIAEREGGPRTLDQRGGLSTTSSGLKRRKYMEAEETEAAAKAKFGEQAEIAQDIRTMPLALAQMEKAIAGRQLINKIKETSKITGEPAVVEGHNPGEGWFHINHPAFFTSRPRFETVEGKKIPLLDQDGSLIFDRVPLWVRGDFEGPLKSFMTGEIGKTYKAMMDLKGQTMSVVMYSPMIHNMVEFGRAFPAAPGKVATFRIYFEGNAAKQGRPYDGTLRYMYDHLFTDKHQIPKTASPTMLEAVDAGLVPIGKRFFNQEISSIMEQPNLTPGRSLTAKILGLVPDLFDPRAGDAVKRSIDRMGDIWHNTLLWDRIGDLQMGLYVNVRDAAIKDGHMPIVAQRMAAHIANRYAGALPKEAMSASAQKIANMTLFSRSFTLGNIGVMKDAFTGLPRDVQAQIARDIGTTDPRAADFAKSMARRKAIAVVALDVGLMYVMNSLLQSGANTLLGDKSIGEEAQGYVRRFNDLMQRVKESPSTVLQPFSMAESLSSTAENEPGKQDRIMVGKTKEGQAIYARNPVGKIGEEFTGWLAHPAAKLQSKLSTTVRPIWQILDNDKGFGRKVYDPHPDTIAKYAGVIGNIAKHFIAAQTPEGALTATKELLTGQGDKLSAAQALAPFTGVTVSKGHPGGPAAGELARVKENQDFIKQQAMPEIRKLVQSGNQAKAREMMNDLKIPFGEQKFILNPHITPRQVRTMNRLGTPEQQERFRRAREGG